MLAAALKEAGVMIATAEHPRTARKNAREGARRLIGEYLPTKKNGMVRDHYQKLGLMLLEQRDDGSTTSAAP